MLWLNTTAAPFDDKAVRPSELKTMSYHEIRAMLDLYDLGDGQATQLREQNEELTERNQSLIKERDTERSKVTLMERDKNAVAAQPRASPAAAPSTCSRAFLPMGS
jgi:hypothetical protein